MTIIGLFYLMLIVGWILLILILKCKRARAKRLAEEAAAAQATQCHIIQIGSNYYDIIPSNHPFNSSNTNYHSCSTLHLDDTNSIGSLHHHHHHGGGDQTHTNPAFVVDEPGGIFPTNGTLPDLPPSYEDVMRLPSSYPKVAPAQRESRLQTAPPPLSRYPDGPAIIEVTNIEDHIRTDTNNNHQGTTQCTCSHGNGPTNNNADEVFVTTNNNNASGLSVRRQSEPT